MYTVHAKEYFDRTYGNSYYSARVFKFVYDRWELMATLPFTYGYDRAAYYDALKECNISEPANVYFVKEQGLTMREVKAWGK